MIIIGGDSLAIPAQISAPESRDSGGICLPQPFHRSVEVARLIAKDVRALGAPSSGFGEALFAFPSPDRAIRAPIITYTLYVV